ncbi:methyltransferase domain-containing protein [Algihabitans albus]|uniref:methyltransferase domain-containing protein n=1 Tax=Algihabitans albus TaxID=2164067 RepID=UPI0013C33C5C|nr:class I SAM-dependent methyltransferase [Algihabitans albus]
MSGFDPAWLALRAPADAEARSPDLLADLSDWAAQKERLSILDLGCGTGATQRAVSPRLPCEQHWLLVDNDSQLLALCPESQGSTEIATIQLDLAADLELLPSESVELVTCSALLDLVSADWLSRLIAQSANAAVYFALSVDGRIALEPALAEDVQVLELVAFHHQRDKSFGPALGYEAAETAAQMLRHSGREVRLERSDWTLGPDRSALQSALLDGYAAAAIEQDSRSTAMVRRWRQARERLSEQRLTVGHLDLLSLPDPSPRVKSNRTSTPSA